MNIGIPYQSDRLKPSSIHQSEIKSLANQIENNVVVSDAKLIQAISFLDLTTLNGNDTVEKIEQLCQTAKKPSSFCNEKVAAICTYPVFIPAVKAALKETGIKVAVAAGGFPHGLSPLSSRLDEVRISVEMGAEEVDVVIRRELALTEQWEELFNEISAMRKACSGAHLKVILATGELKELELIYKASMVSMMAGADFIKTSTGKDGDFASAEAGLVMMKAIRDFKEMTDRMVGFKASGGIKTLQQACLWIDLVHQELGEPWMSPNLFRMGASSLLDAINAQLKFPVSI